MDLSRNALGDEGAKALAYGGVFKGGLTSLNLFYNQIGADGAKALAAAIATSGSMPRQLILRGNLINIDGAQALAKAMLSVTSAAANDQIDMRANRLTMRQWHKCCDAEVDATQHTDD